MEIASPNETAGSYAGAHQEQTPRRQLTRRARAVRTNRLSTLGESAQPAPQDTLEVLKRGLQEFASERLTDDVCLLPLRA